LAGDLGLPTDGPWQVELEWCDAKNLLKESGTQRTQVDAKATSPSALILFECKFTESGGGCCSQVKPLVKGSHRGVRQCDGTYRMQVNPVNSVQARCTLTGKGIRYWKVIPRIFDLQSTANYTPCPFRNSAYQWMRNLALAHELCRNEGKRAAFVIVHADSPWLRFTEYLKSHEWSALIARLRPNTVAFGVRSFNWILIAGQETVDPEWTDLWRALQEWLQTKINRSRESA